MGYVKTKGEEKAEVGKQKQKQKTLEVRYLFILHHDENVLQQVPPRNPLLLSFLKLLLLLC